MAGWFQRLKNKLNRSVQTLGGRLNRLFVRAKFDEEALRELELVLLAQDVGPETTHVLMERVRKQDFPPETTEHEVRIFLAKNIFELLSPFERTFEIFPEARPKIVLIVGVNGAGKTSTLGKLASRCSVLSHVVAADTFRAGAVHQLRVWAERTSSTLTGPLKEGQDPASVVFRGMQEGRNSSCIWIDTAGRLQNKHALMDELEKIVRVIKKQDPSGPHETFLVLDGSVGQNGYAQIEGFVKAVPVTGLVVTKLDGGSKVGVLLGLVERFRIPIVFIGIGEGPDDIQPFSALEYACALMGVDLPPAHVSLAKSAAL